MQAQASPDSQSSQRRWSIGRILLRLPIIVIDEFTIILGLLLILKLAIGERWEIIALGNSLLPPMLVIALVLLVIALLRRRLSMIVILLPAAVVFVVSYGVLFVPRPIASPDAQATQVKVLTYNIHSEAVALDSVVALIREADADVVAVQELSSQAAIYFAKELAAVYPHQAVHTKEDEPVIGMGVLSRYPVVADDYWRNDALPAKLAQQRVQIETNRVRFTMYNAHPVGPGVFREGSIFYTGARHQEIESVLKRADQDSGPVIIMGDFNLADQSDDYRWVTAHYSDTYREVGWGLGATFPDYTNPATAPTAFRSVPIPLLVRLDYVFHNSQVQALEAKVWHTSGGSDHRPVFARLILS